MLTVFAICLLVSIIYMSLAFVFSLFIKRTGIVDVFWGIGFIVLTTCALLLSGSSYPRQVLIICLVTIWGLRLAIYIAVRSIGKGDDKRYIQIKQRFGAWVVLKSYFYIFVVQAILLFLISSSAIYTAAASDNSWGVLDFIGTLVWLVGFSFEAIADLQMYAFKQKVENKGKVMDTGLWRYSRHPNYFGESLVWVGIWLITSSLPGGWVFIFSPVLITFLLLRVSGVKIIESNHKDDPEYLNYISNTSSFIPLPKLGKVHQK